MTSCLPTSAQPPRPNEFSNLPGCETTIFPESPPDAVPVFDYSYKGAERSFEDSLSRLSFSRDNCGISRIVGLRIHDAESPETLRQASSRKRSCVRKLRELREKGLIRDISIGMNDASYILQMIGQCSKGTFDSVMMAGCWNLLDPTMQGLEVLQLCEKLGIEVHLAGVFASGLLVGKDTYKYSKAPPEKIELTMKWSTLCDKYGLPLPAVALSFALLPKVVSKVAVGIGKPEELMQCCQWVEDFKVPLILWEEAIDMKLLPKWTPIPTRVRS